MSEHYNRRDRCVYCLKHEMRSKMTSVPTTPEVRAKYGEILGADFLKRCQTSCQPRICLSHFEIINGKRMREQLPIKMDMNMGCSSQKRSESPKSNVLPAEECEVLLDSNTVTFLKSNTDSDDRSVSNSPLPENEEQTFPYCYFLCEMSCIEHLLKFCQKCSSSDVSIKFEPVGAAIEASCICNCCKTFWKWFSSTLCDSQNRSVYKKLRNINIDITSCIVTSGTSYSKLRGFFGALECPFFSKTTFHSLKKKFVYPAVDQFYEEQRDEVQMLISSKIEKGEGLNIAGDGQYDSRGYSAYYCRYSIMDVETKLVLDYENSRKERGESSLKLEPLCHKNVIQRVAENYYVDGNAQTPIKSITTDRHRIIAANMKKDFPDVKHYYDAWHFLRNITLDLMTKKKQKQFAPLAQWTRSFMNHLYWALTSSNGDGEIAKEKAMSFFAHVLNKHDNFQDIDWFSFKTVHCCSHDDVPDSDYLNEGDRKHMKAWQCLFSLLNKGTRLEDFAHVSPYFATSALESFNSIATYYAPKELFFSSKGFDSCMRVSIIHWNSLQFQEMEGLRPVKGTKKFYCKTRKEVVLKDRKAVADLTWRIAIKKLARLYRYNEKNDFNTNSDSELSDSEAESDELVGKDQYNVDSLLSYAGNLIDRMRIDDFISDEE